MSEYSDCEDQDEAQFMARQRMHNFPLDYSDRHKGDRIADFLPASEGGNGQWEQKYKGKDNARAHADASFHRETERVPLVCTSPTGPILFR